MAALYCTELGRQASTAMHCSAMLLKRYWALFLVVDVQGVQEEGFWKAW